MTWRSTPMADMPEAPRERSGETGLRALAQLHYLDTFAGGQFVDDAPPSGWSDHERQLLQRLGPAPPFGSRVHAHSTHFVASAEEQVAFADYQARYATALCDDPPPGVMGASLLYLAKVAQQTATQAFVAMDAPEVTTAADPARAAAHAAEATRWAREGEEEELTEQYALDAAMECVALEAAGVAGPRSGGYY